MPENTRNDVFLGAFDGIYPESAASGVEKWISGFFRASGDQKFIFLHPRKVPPPGKVPCCPGECPAYFFYAQNAP
jgi:hypothetical protein